MLAIRREWAADMREKDPEFFNRLMSQQNPEYLWIGCSDSRVPVSTAAAAGPWHGGSRAWGVKRVLVSQQHHQILSEPAATLWAYAGQAVALHCSAG